MELLRDVIKYNWAGARTWAVSMGLSLCLGHDAAKMAALQAGMVPAVVMLFGQLRLEPDVATATRLLVLLCEADGADAACSVARTHLIAPLLSSIFALTSAISSSSTIQSLSTMPPASSQPLPSSPDTVAPMSLLCWLLRMDQGHVLFPPNPDLVHALDQVLRHFAGQV